MRARALTTILALLAASFAVHSPAASAAGETAVLRGTTRVKASRSAVMQVRLARPAKISLSFTDDFQNLAGARFSEGHGLAAVMLAPAEAQPQPVGAVRMPRAEGATARVVGVGPRACAAQAACELAAGLYRLYVVTDEPVVAELQIQGIGGSTTLRPTQPVRAGVHGADASYSYEVPYTVTGASAYGGGIVPELDTEFGMIFYSLWFRGASEGPASTPPADNPPLQVGEVDGCFYGGAPPAGTAFSPGCPGGLPRGSFTSLKALDDYRYQQWGTEVGLGSGTYGLGGWAVHTGIFDPGVAGFWLDLRG